VKIYDQYPKLNPFVGDRYREKEGTAPRLLIIGESSYLPEKYESLTTAEKWYEGKQSDHKRPVISPTASIGYFCEACKI